jgi:hypothetical protein
MVGLCHCGRYLTDGYIDEAQTRAISTAKVRADLNEAGLWIDREDRDGKKAGVDVHDFLDLNPTREDVEELRRKRSEAGRLGGVRSGEARREANASGVLQAQTNPVPSASSTTSAEVLPFQKKEADVIDLRQRSRRSERSEDGLPMLDGDTAMRRVIAAADANGFPVPEDIREAAGE